MVHVNLVLVMGTLILLQLEIVIESLENASSVSDILLVLLVKNVKKIIGDLPSIELAHPAIVIELVLSPSSALMKLESVNVTKIISETNVILVSLVTEISKKDVRNVIVTRLDLLESTAILSVGNVIAKLEFMENNVICVLLVTTTSLTKVALSAIVMITDLSIKSAVTLLENAYVERMWKELVVIIVSLAFSISLLWKDVKNVDVMKLDQPRENATLLQVSVYVKKELRD